MKKKRVTLLDVAKHAGVSRATASLIVRGSPNIAEKTRKKVLQSMRELGYVYDRVAANMRSQSSTTVGLIITDIANPFFSELLIGVHNELENAGYIVLLGTTFDSDSKQERLVSTMLEHRVGGVILCPVSNTSNETIERIKNLDIPIITAVRELSDIHSDYVGIDYATGSLLAVNHLIELGHQRIAFLGGAKESSAWIERKKGYCNSLLTAGLEVDNSLIIESSVTREGGLQAVQKLLNQPNRPTAIFCFNDIVALGVMQGLRDAGITIGQDIAVVGFDNVQEASLFNPPLTTVSSFPRLIGTQAAKLLHERMKNLEKEKQHIIIKPELVIRETT
ncbi:LacI family DNA-binding transcriptional regulator [Alkalihalobacillus sp. MEB130]|uniref:LacI family DNA-binding transcriptional regulator n=1 Tax=Alkalihalobacillus sp. MEB130 TaxID=2976704 RepID=UPI0028E09D5B|nr:LacI family DNA-binding transcriptional regulator [Alkalihalobacillus sp. MEB130]MDT8861474.1 LacI family DNA-binding transcriptional regulator [Alkalihalobacillus sp. MEB130]